MSIRDQIIELNRGVADALEWLSPFFPWMLALAILAGIIIGY